MAVWHSVDMRPEVEQLIADPVEWRKAVAQLTSGADALKAGGLTMRRNGGLIKAGPCVVVKWPERVAK